MGVRTDDSVVLINLTNLCDKQRQPFQEIRQVDLLGVKEDKRGGEWKNE